MKNTKTIVFAIFLGGLFFISGCNQDDPQASSETEKVTALLKANTWAMQTVTVDGIDKTSLYAGLLLSFTDTNFTTINGGSIWPASGTWAFADQTAKQIIRNDDLVVMLEEVSLTKLTLKLTWSKTTLGGGRGNSVSGAHVFVFGK